MKQYLDLCRHVLENGTEREDRTGTGTIGTFGYQMRFDLSKGFPLLTTKKLHLRSVIHELLWFLKGDTNTEYLNENGVHIWDEWADDDGGLGPIYGKQWRSWGSYEWHESEASKAAGYGLIGDGWRRKPIDQLKEVVNSIKYDPYSRRHIVSAWNVGELNQMALPPCHLLFQFYVSNGKLSCQLYQRSADIFLGVPFNIASYSLLTMMIARVSGLGYGEFIHTIGDAHIYNNHTEQVMLQLTREPKKLPFIHVRGKSNINDYVFEDFKLIGYDAHPHIKGEVSV